MSDILTEAWQTKTDYERYEDFWIKPKFNQRPISLQDGYSHNTIDSGDSRHFVPDTHPEDTWN